MMDTEAIVQAGQLIGEPKLIPSEPSYAVVPEGAALESLERFGAAPARMRGKIVAHDVETFTTYFNDFAGAESRIFADLKAVTIVGVLDYHDPKRDQPAGWREHAITYVAPKSPEWLVWTGHSGKKMSQVDFATFIEDNLPDIVEPAGAEVLEIARTLEARKKVEFASSVRLADGSFQLTYNETVSEVKSKGSITVPDHFTLGIPVFLNDEPYRVNARLRFRIEEGRLSFWYDLHRPEKIVEDAFTRVIGAVAEQTGRFVHRGTAG